jgi:hypothetical protein
MRLDLLVVGLNLFENHYTLQVIGTMRAEDLRKLVEDKRERWSVTHRMEIHTCGKEV